MLNQREFNNTQQDAKMGNTESSQSSDVGGLTGVTGQSSFHRQSPNVARLIRSENSSKMEYEFPISDVPINTTSVHHGTGTNLGKHTILSGKSNRLNYSSVGYSSTSGNDHQMNPTGYQLDYSGRKLPSNSASSLWFSLTSCFGCRIRNTTSSNMNPLRDKVHAIRIVRASNDLTPAVFDSHYNIITLEQLRECDTNANVLANDITNPISSPNVNTSMTTAAQNGNGSVAAGFSSTSSAVAGSKKDKSHRMRKKKKKRMATTKTISCSDDDDDDIDDRSSRT